MNGNGVMSSPLSSPPGDPPHATPLQRRWVQACVSLGSSLALHAGLLILGLLTYKVVETVAPAQREQVVIPDAAIVEGAPIGGVPDPGLGEDPLRAAAAEQIATDDRWSDPAQAATDRLMGGGDEMEDDSVIGIGPRVAGVGEGRGEADGGAPALPFGPPGGGAGLGPQAPFLGLSGNARRVVYICDASGTMMTVFPSVRAELRKALDVLKPIQAFNVIFFKDEQTMTVSRDGLLVANADNKRGAVEFAQAMSAAGLTDPLPAIRMAFAQKPELIYLLTDGFDNVDSFDAVIEEFRRLNRDRRVRVNAILIRSAEAEQLEQVLRTIAEENGGRFRIVEKNDF